MIEPLDWDSAFFGRSIGALRGPFAPEAIAGDLRRAEADGFAYLMARPPVDDAAAIRALEQAGFYLTDLGATWRAAAAPGWSAAGADATVRLATGADVPWLRDQAVRLFRQSRFYHDPFYSAEEADRLHAAWIANSVAGQAADAVWVAPDEGFVTCRVTRDGAGEVVLIGVGPEAQGRGVGRRLMSHAMQWFAARPVAEVRVKTQVKNLRAMNFYHRLGFDLHGTDVTMGYVVGPRATGRAR